MRAMRLGIVIATIVVLSTAAWSRVAHAQPEDDRAIPVTELRSGQVFQSPETQALQNDEFANPGALWLDRGAALYAEPAGASGKACADCHGADGAGLNGVAARHPAFAAGLGRVANLEQRINHCRSNRQQAPKLAWESDALLSLTTYVASLSRGTPTQVSIDGPARPVFEAGKRTYYERLGQLNLACKHCHEDNWGRMLRGDRLSQGHGVGYPAYRIEWRGVGSLHRRLRFCNTGVRAEPFDYGAPEYVALELFLAWRAQGLPGEAPAVRR